MAKVKSQTFYRTFFLVTFLVFVISLETAAKQVKPAAGGTENKEGARFSRWLEQAEGKASKRRLRRMVHVNPYPEHGFVYLIAAFEDKKVDAAFVKIGKSRDPSDRVKGLQTGSPYPLTVVHKWEVTDMSEAEKKAHIAMAKWNRAHLYRNTRFRYWKTEWFNIPEGRLENVEGIVTNAMVKYLA